MNAVSRIALICSLLMFGSVGFADANRPEKSTEQRIQQLIRQLGSKSYGVRKHAESELRQLGAEAIEQLLEAQYDDSTEISLAAQQLLGSFNLKWTSENDVEITHQIMRGFSSQPTSTKLARASWLARLEDGAGYAPLCRIVRYEPSELIAKRAALSLITEIDDEEPNRIEALRNAVQSVVQDASRPAATWLAAFSESLKDPRPLHTERWQQFIAAERELATGLRSDDQIKASLYSVLAELASARNQTEVLGQAIEGFWQIQKDNENAILNFSH